MSDYNFKFQRYQPREKTNAPGTHLHLGKNSRLYVGGSVYTLLGRPSHLLVDFDIENLAFKLLPADNDLARAMKATVGKGRGPESGCSMTVAKLPPEMPLGYYNPISHDIFVHESKQR